MGVGGKTAPTGKWKAIGLRWWDFLFLTCFAVAVTLLLRPLLRIMEGWFHASLKTDPQWLIFILASVLISLPFFWLTALGGFRVGQLRPKCFFAFPPTWMSGLAGCALYILLAGDLRRGITTDSLVLLCLPIGMLLAFGVPNIRHLFIWVEGKCGKKKDENTGDRKTVSDLLSDPDAFDEWLDRDEPIKHPKDDRFGHYQNARRIARKLLEPNIGTIGLVGEYGCGKSSILNLVEHYLDHPDDIDKAYPDPGNMRMRPKHLVWCRIASWGVGQEDVPSFILRQALNRAADALDVVPFANLPESYGQALKEVHTAGAVLASLLKQDGTPEDVLRKLDTALLCVNRRLVIALEDMDRNPEYEKVMAQLCALLDRLKDLDNITFVAAFGQESIQSNALIKVLEHTEYVSGMDKPAGAELLGIIRNQFLNDSDVTQAVSHKDREFQLGFRETPRSDGFMYDLLGLLGVPRRLKHVLRRCRFAWESLKDEVDCDDLLLVHVLRECVPEAYAFVSNHLGSLRTAKNWPSRNELALDTPSDERKLAEGWEQATEEITWDVSAAREVIMRLFRVGEGEAGTWPQSVRIAQPTDYWARLHAEEIAPEEIRDQHVLRVIRAWQNGADNTKDNAKTLPELVLEKEGFVEKVEQFGGLLDGKKVRKLASDYFTLILQGRGERQPHRPLENPEVYPGFIELRRLAADKCQENEEWQDWIVGCIAQALQTDLRFANELFWYWLSPSKNRSQPTPEIRSKAIQAFNDAYRGKPEVLAKALDPDFPQGLSRFLVDFDRPQSGGTGFEPDEWKPLAQTMLDAAAMAPDKVVPQLACLLTEHQDIPDVGWRASVDEERTKGIFGDDLDRLARTLLRDLQTEPESPQAQASLVAAREFAENWLKEHGEE